MQYTTYQRDLTKSTTFPQDLSSNALKYIALIAMFFDHFFAGFLPQETVVGFISRIPGRVVAPIFCYFIAMGYFYTSNIRKYIERLVIFAAISHFPYVLYFNLSWWKTTSVMWSLALGLIALAIVKSEKLPMYAKIGLVFLCCLLAYPADWNFVGVLWIVFFGIYRGQLNKQIISFVIIGIFAHLIPQIINMGWHHAYQIGIFLAIPLLLMYKGRRGQKSTLLKWGFYIFYPLHLTVFIL
ncbi:TraX family protein [Bacillus timonensis]|uniref:TraX family protein n=1 Tax=Bacillus timonensis TaxID=1033734 RepID=UPI000289F8B9|nr:TraX family protein [Bacillus timonensis]